jgi:hypothetical protein
MKLGSEIPPADNPIVPIMADTVPISLPIENVKPVQLLSFFPCIQSSDLMTI